MLICKLLLVFLLCMCYSINGVIFMTTGQRIKEARKKARLTQAELAKKLGIPYQSIGQWERDLRKPKIETRRRIAAAIGVSFFDLLSKEELALYDSGLEEGTKMEEWQNHVIDELDRREGYTHSDIETRLINSFSQLNDDGQQKAVEHVEDLAGNPKYQRTAAPESTPAPPEGKDTPYADTPTEGPPEDR